MSPRRRLTLPPKPPPPPKILRSSLEDLERRLDYIMGLHGSWTRYGELRCLACDDKTYPCPTLRAARGDIPKTEPAS